VPERDLRTRLRHIFNSNDLPFDEAALKIVDEGLAKFESNGSISLSDNGAAWLEERKNSLVWRKHQQAIKAKRQTIAEAPRPAREIHDGIQKQVGDVGKLLGMTWKQEHTLVRGGSVRLDVVWFAHPSGRFTHAFEIQHHGSWKNAIGNLEAVRRRDENCSLYLVVVEKREINRINMLLGETQDESIVTLRASQFTQWHDILSRSGQEQDGLSTIRQQLESFGLV